MSEHRVDKCAMMRELAAATRRVPRPEVDADREGLVAAGAGARRDPRALVVAQRRRIAHAGGAERAGAELQAGLALGGRLLLGKAELRPQVGIDADTWNR